jgi:hypothetical protein
MTPGRWVAGGAAVLALGAAVHFGATRRPAPAPGPVEEESVAAVPAPAPAPAPSPTAIKVGDTHDFARARAAGEDRALAVLDDALARAEKDRGADPKYVASLRDLRARRVAQRATRTGVDDAAAAK